MERRVRATWKGRAAVRILWRVWWRSQKGYGLDLLLCGFMLLVGMFTHDQAHGLARVSYIG